MLRAPDVPDACPGALTVHQAADGGLARVRAPGGRLTAAQLTTLAHVSERLGSGVLELTSRGNLQLRGLGPGAETELGEVLAAAGLLPSATHERVRNIVASPLSGLDDAGLLDVSAVVSELDRLLCATPELAELPGRFLFAIDDGRRDVVALEADVTAVALDGATFAVRPGRIVVDGGVVRLVDTITTAAGVPTAMIEAAGEFLRARAALGSNAWRVHELPGASVAVPEGSHAGAEPAGITEQPDGHQALAVLVPMGRLAATDARTLAALAGPGGLRVTPWHSIVLTDLADAGLVRVRVDALGLGVNADSPWYRVSACTGRPGCARALADVQADARADLYSRAVLQRPLRESDRVRWSGCGRRCGRPSDTTVDIVATESGYLVGDITQLQVPTQLEESAR